MSVDWQVMRALVRARLGEGVPAYEIARELEWRGVSRLEAESLIVQVRNAPDAWPVGMQPPGGPDLRYGRQGGWQGPAAYGGRTSKPFTGTWWGVALIGALFLPAGIYLWFTKLDGTDRARAIGALFGIGFAVFIALAVAGFILEGPERELVKQQNAAAAAGERSSGEPGSVSIFELRVDDCFNERIPDEGAMFETVERVACAGAWQYRIERQLLLPGGFLAQYPDVEYFDDLFLTDCPEEATYYFYPTIDSWDMGDRVLSCLVEW